MTDDAPPKKRGRPRTRPEPNDPVEAARIERLREVRNEWQKERNANARDIGSIRPPVDAKRRAECRMSFRSFCETYLEATFNMDWSPDHLEVIAMIEAAVLHGKLLAFAMPRGSGKTSLCEAAAIWALVYAHRKFVVLIGSDADAACGMLATLRAELESNDLLDEDFPEVCQPIRALEGIAHRANGQTCEGERTKISWNSDEVVLPTVGSYPTSGSIVKVCGITGRIRGMAHKTMGGEKIRPDLVIVDDPQTDESANSLQQCATREAVLNGAVLGLAGPGKRIAGFMPCTVIRPGDLADTMLNRKKYPEWQGKRFKLMLQFPTNMKRWEEYAELRARLMENEQPLAEANDFYIEHRAELDEGAIVAWEERKTADEVSAIQHAMHLYLRNKVSFMSEYNNDPFAKSMGDGDEDPLTSSDILRKLNARKEGLIPQFATRLTAFIDVGKDILYYAVAAWSDRFDGAIVKYGTFPDQRLTYFLARDAKNKLGDLLPGESTEAAITEGLRRIVEHLLLRKWTREDDVELTIERLLIDANWKSDTIYEFCKTSPFANLLTPSHGQGVRSSQMPLGLTAPKPGERVGLNWRVPIFGAGKRTIRFMRFDTNFWKTFVKDRWKTPPGGNGSLSIWGTEAHLHRLYADHQAAEYFVKTAGHGREIDEWQIRPERFDNHWFDCTVGCAVAASMQGANLPEVAASQVREKKRVSFSEMQRRKMERRKLDEGGS